MIKHWRTVTAAVVASALGVGAMTVPNVNAAPSQPKTTSQRIVFDCFLTGSNNKGTIDGVYDGNSYKFNYDVKVTAPETVNVGDTFDYTIDSGFVGLPNPIPGKVNVTVKGASQARVKYTTPTNATINSVTKSGGSPAANVTQDSGVIRIGGDSDTDSWNMNSYGAWKHGGLVAQSQSGKIGYQVPAVTMNMTATEEGSIQPGFPTEPVAENSASSWVTLYAEASANVLFTTINAKAVARCAPKPGAQLPAVKVLKAAEKAVDDIQVQPAAEVEAGSDASLSAKVTKKGAPVAGQEVTFKLDGRTATGVSNEEGIATAAIRTVRAGDRTFTAAIGDLTAQGTVHVNAKDSGEAEDAIDPITGVDVKVTDVVELGDTVRVTAKVTKDGELAANQKVIFNLDGQKIEAVTNDQGEATAELTATVVGSRTVSAISNGVKATAPVKVTEAADASADAPKLTAVTAEPATGAAGAEFTATATFDKAVTGHVEFFLQGRKVEGADKDISDATEVTSTMKLPANPGKHQLTARFYGPHGVIQDATASVTTQDTTVSQTAGTEKGTYEGSVHQVNGAEPTIVDGMPVVKPGDKVTYKIRTSDPSSTAIYQLGLNPPAGWEPADGDGKGILEGGSQVLVDRGGKFVGPSNFSAADAKWADHGMSPNAGYRGYATNGWTYVYRSGTEELTVTYVVPADVQPGDYSSQIGVLKYASDKSRSLNNVPELTVRVAAGEMAPAKAEQTIVVQPHRTELNLGEDLAVTATVTDANGDPVANESVDFKLGTQTHTATTNSEGVATWSLTTTQGGELTITATTAKSAGRSTVTVKAADAEDPAVTKVQLTGPKSARTDSTAKYSAVVLDQEDVLMANQKVTFTHNGATSEVTTDDQGKAVFTVENLTEGTHTVVAAVGEVSSETITTEVSDKATDVLVETLALDSPAATAAGKALDYTVTAQDADGNPLPNKAVFVTYNGQTQTVTTGPDGKANVSFPAVIGGGDVVFVSEGISATDTPVVQPAGSDTDGGENPDSGDNSENPGTDETPGTDSGSTGTSLMATIGIVVASIFGVAALGGIIGLLWPVIAKMFNLPGVSLSSPTGYGIKNGTKNCVPKNKQVHPKQRVCKK